MTATQRPPNIDEETRAFREWHAAVSRPPPGRFIFAGATMLSFDRTGKRRSALAWGETDAEMPWTRRRMEAGDGLGGPHGPPGGPRDTCDSAAEAVGRRPGEHGSGEPPAGEDEHGEWSVELAARRGVARAVVDRLTSEDASNRRPLWLTLTPTNCTAPMRKCRLPGGRGELRRRHQRGGRGPQPRSGDGLKWDALEVPISRLGSAHVHT